MSGDYHVDFEEIDLYKILGLDISVCNDPECDSVIRKAFIKKVQKYHPDKQHGNSDLSSNDVSDMFDLLTNAYEVLKTKSGRDQYNALFKATKYSTAGYNKLAAESKKYFESFPEITDEERKQKQLIFDKKNNEMNTVESSFLTEEDAKKRYGELMSLRSIDDETLKPDKIFDGSVFDRDKFNAAFDKVHKRETDLVPRSSVPLAWDSSGSKFSSFNDSADDFFMPYSKVTHTEPVKLTKEEVQQLEGINYIETAKYKDIKQSLKERENETQRISSLKYNDYDRSNDPYSFTQGLGLTFDDKFDTSTKESNKRIMASYNKLIGNYNN